VGSQKTGVVGGIKKREANVEFQKGKKKPGSGLPFRKERKGKGPGSNHTVPLVALNLKIWGGKKKAGKALQGVRQ